jgi:hypothetical protein
MGPGIIPSLRLCAGGPRRWRAAAGVLAGLVLAPSAASAQSLPATADTQVAVIDTSSIIRIDNMDFGKIAQPNAPGTVVLSAGQNATCTATGGLVRTSTCRAAHFSVNGKKNKRIMIRENNGGTITLNGPTGATMTVTDLSFAVSQMSGRQGAGGWTFGSWQIDSASGIAEFWIGGTLHVGSGQVPGVYVGALNMQINTN